MSVREEGLKNNVIDLVARSEELEKTWTDIGLLKGELARLYEEGRLLRLQLDEVKAATANAVSEYQSSEEMATFKKTFYNEGYEEAAEAFAYIAAITHLDWDLTFLGEHMVDQITAWCAKHQATHLPTDERPVSQLL